MKPSQQIKRIQKTIEKLNKTRVVVGIIGGTHTSEDGSTFDMAAMGAVHEFGTEITVTPKMRAYLHYRGIHLRKTTTTVVIPERSFLRASLTKHKDYYKALLKQEMRKAVMGRQSVWDAHQIVGAVAAGKAQEIIADSDGIAPLARPRADGSSRPLYDTGQLIQSITWETRNEN